MTLITYLFEALLQVFAIGLICALVIVPTEMFVKWILNSFESTEDKATGEQQ